MRHRVLPLTAILAIVSVACTAPAGSGTGSTSGAASSGPIPDAAMLTAYDPASPLGTAVESAVETADDGVAIHDVTWDSPGGGRVSAWLVVPTGEGPFAGIVYLHGSETDRDDFLDEAVAMAHGGAASVVLNAPFSRSGKSRHAFLSNFGLADRERDMPFVGRVPGRRAGSGRRATDIARPDHRPPFMDGLPSGGIGRLGACRPRTRG
jgi:hypothetical protein